MPPITVVWPSLTSTCVMARCGRRAGGRQVHDGARRNAGRAGARNARQRTVVWERQRRRVAERRADLTTEAPLIAEGAREILVRLHDARFDLDLRLRAVD